MKTCQQFRQWIWLDLYNELLPDQKENLADHLKRCLDCQLDYQAAKKTVELLDQKIQLEPTENELAANRADLHQRLLFIKHSQSEKRWWEKLWQIMSLDFAPQYRLATALAMLIVGIFFGRYLLLPSQTLQSHELDFADANIAGVDYVQYNPNTKQVSIKLNTMNDIVVEGGLERPEIQTLLAQALEVSDRPNVRLKTVGVLSFVKTLNKPLLDALIDLIEHDNNPGIRLKAIKLLNTLPLDAEVKELIIDTLAKVLLKEKNSAIRNEAINGLTKMNDLDVAPMVLNTARSDTSEYIQYKASQVLARTKLERLNNNK